MPAHPTTIEEGGLVRLFNDQLEEGTAVRWEADDGILLDPNGNPTQWDTTGLEVGSYRITSYRPATPEDELEEGDEVEIEVMDVAVTTRGVSPSDTLNIDSGNGPLPVTLQRSDVVDTADQALWSIIRHSVDQLSFRSYEDFVTPILCGQDGEGTRATDELLRQRSLPFPDIDPYRVLKAATEVFLTTHCGVVLDGDTIDDLFPTVAADERERLGLGAGGQLDDLWQGYYERVNGSVTLPYLELIRRKLSDVPLKDDDTDECYGILRDKLTRPCLLSLIWSYWQEEGMLVQTMNVVSRRFQNQRGPGRVDPLADLELDPLRPLSNLLWGYIQDEQHRLTLVRRAYEYDHHYGLTLVGQAVPRIRPADSRSKFLEGFHNLLHRASIFYKEDDDTTMIADPFPVLNALRDVHMVLAEGAHNQYGDLPWTARHEMLMQQWLLARPEFRQFLPGRTMVVYPEAWMDRVDAMKRLQGWTDTSVRHFRDLAVTGEPLLLSIRFGNWTAITNRNSAANWARYWRQEVQWYIQSYQSVTGVDLSADTSDVRADEPGAARYAQPAVHLTRRLAQQRRTTQRELIG